MRTLQRGMSGPDVAVLQRKLQDRGFPPGALDGDFGPGTEAAVLAFQRSEAMLADGVVGLRTAAALGLDVGAASPLGMPEVTVAIVSKMFPATPLDPIKRNLPAVLQELSAAALTSVPVVSAVLATIRAETEGFVPMAEMVRTRAVATCS